MPANIPTSGINKNETQAAAAALLYFFLLIMAYYVLKPLRESLTLNLGVAQIPRMNLVALLSLVLANAGYTWIVGIWPRERFIPAVTRLFSAAFILFWAGYRFCGQDQPCTAPDQLRILFVATFSMLVTAFSLISVSMFWSFMNDIFSSRQATRLYSFIGYGGLLGGLSGGILTAVLPRILETSWLFVLAALLLEPTVWCMRFIHKQSVSWRENADKSVISPENTDAADAADADKDPNSAATASAANSGNVPGNSGRLPGATPWEGLIQIFKVPLLFFLALEMLFYTISGAIFQYQIGKVLTASLTSLSAQTIFIAQVYNALNVMALGAQFLLTRPALRSRLPIIGLVLIPLVQLSGSVLYSLWPGLYLAAGIFALRSALNYSIGRAVRELMFTPLSRNEKYQGKGFIDTIVFRAGTGISAGFLLLGVTTDTVLNLLIILLSFASFLVIHQIWRTYQAKTAP